ncbi:MAG: YraN family protein [Lachnospiraceae bacterium]
MNRRKLGTAYEQLAVGYLMDQGINILERNYHSSHGEIDIVARDGDTLVFFEVKYRKNADFGQPWEAVAYPKQKRICQAAREYCYKRKIVSQVRYDVISILGDEIEWYKNAFLHMGKG